jgi:hypothetical protein
MAIRSIGQASIALGTKTDSDLARPPIRNGRGALAKRMVEVHSYTLWRPSPRRQPTRVIHREGRHRAESTAGAPTSNTSEPASLDADLKDPQEKHDSLVIATQRGHPARGLKTIQIHTMHIEGASRLAAVDWE